MLFRSPFQNGDESLLNAALGSGFDRKFVHTTRFTSGKVSSRSFVSVKYGMIETRVRVPDLNLGGWPAFWMLGTSNYTWPDCGEVDFMEMGGAQAFRNAHDSHNGGNGLHNSTVNQMVGSNAIYGSNGVVSIANDPSDTFNRPYYNYTKPLNGRLPIALLAKRRNARNEFSEGRTLNA